MPILDRTYNSLYTLTITEFDGQFMAQLTVHPEMHGVFEAIDVRPHLADMLCKALDDHGGFELSTTGGDPVIEEWSIKAEVVKI